MGGWVVGLGWVGWVGGLGRTVLVVEIIFDGAGEVLWEEVGGWVSIQVCLRLTCVGGWVSGWVGGWVVKLVGKNVGVSNV